MSLTRPLTDMREQLNRMFEITEDFGFPVSLRNEWPLLREKARNWFPSIEIRDNDNQFVLKAEMPGLKPEDISVEVNENYVVISGESKETKKEESENLCHSEFRYGSFYRRIALPASVQSETTKAEYKNGILELRLPKKVTTQTKRIAITTK